MLINGSLSSKFGDTYGLRPGKPFSPYLFNLETECLSTIITRATKGGMFSGIKIEGIVQASHLQFADDTLLFSPNEIKSLLNSKRAMR